MEPASENFELCTEMLKEADPENLYLPALAGYPYMMTPDQIAEFTGLSSQGVRKLLTKRQMTGTRVGNRWLVPKLALLRLLRNGCESPSNEEEAADESAEMRQALQR